MQGKATPPEQQHPSIDPDTIKARSWHLLPAAIEMSSSYSYSGYAPGLAAGAVGLGLLYQFFPALRANTSPDITPGKIVLTAVALFTSTGCYLADWSDSHVFNPRWPPHAKFHNGTTMGDLNAYGLHLTNSVV
jgi:hypothetical protein